MTDEEHLREVIREASAYLCDKLDEYRDWLDENDAEASREFYKYVSQAMASVRAALEDKHQEADRGQTMTKRESADNKSGLEAIAKHNLASRNPDHHDLTNVDIFDGEENFVASLNIIELQELIANMYGTKP